MKSSDTTTQAEQRPIILGVESSCDETAIAIIRGSNEVLSSKVSSQLDVHAVFGGVVPEIAAREHLRTIYPLFQEALTESGVDIKDIAAIAVTQGPGLVGALLVGASFAKGLATSLELPLIPVDHVHAHVHGALLALPADAELFPALTLVASGGHTNLYYMRSAVDFELMASTVDDACGESFDKVAKLLGLPYPGGPIIEKLARQGDAKIFPMPTMVADSSKLFFSYSGLKTHMVQLHQRLSKTSPMPWPEQQLADFCAAFQEEALGQLVRKTLHCKKKIEETEGKADVVRSILVAGGVAANLRFRDLMLQSFGTICHFPALKYCMDNAAMIAALGAQIFAAKGKDAFPTKDWDVYSQHELRDTRV